MDSEINNLHLSGMTPAEIAEHVKDIYPEYGDLNAEEVLLMQESAFLYIEHNKQKGIIASDSGETSNSSLVLTHESGSSRGASVERQLALDEAFARALELGEDFNNLYDHEHEVHAVEATTPVFSAETTESTSRGTSSRVVENHVPRQDDIDPDRMTYEELQSLGESVGTHSKGLCADLIDRLPIFKHKTSLFSKKKNRENAECVICYSDYKRGDKLTPLPCFHTFHSTCITTWLRLNKQCPICQKEVQDE